MQRFTSYRCLTPALAITILVIVIPIPVYGQITTLCTSSMLRSFNPCMNFITGSSGYGTSPTSDCCESLKSLMSSGRDCLCLIITGGVPFRVPINRTVAASLPRACGTSGVPIECKAMGAPIPAPGPDTSGSDIPPTGFDPQSPSWLSDPNVPALTPPGQEGDGSSLTPPGMTPPAADVFPSMTPPGVRPDLSASESLKSLSQLLLLALCGVAALIYS